jgi:hypothetical protein
MKRYIKATVRSLSDMDWKEHLDILTGDDTPTEVLEEIANLISGYPGYSFYHELITHPNVTPEIIDLVFDSMISDPKVGANLDVCKDIALDSTTSKNTLKKLVDYALEHSDWYGWDPILQAVAENPNVSLQTLRKLSNYHDYDVCWRVALNPNASPAILKRLLNRSDSFTGAVLSNPNAPIEMLIKYSNSSNHWARESVAENKSTPPEILTKLANDESHYVRVAVAENENTPIEVLQQLLKDEDYGVMTSAELALRDRG